MKRTENKSATDRKRQIRSDVARAIIHTRGLLDMSITDFASALGTTRQTVTTWETGGAMIDVGTLTDWLYSQSAWVRDLSAQISTIQFGHFFTEA